MGAVEVKKPPNETQASKGVDLNFDKPDQLIQYMHDLRASYGVRFVLGIFTNYEKWCFYWFKDSDSAVKESTLDGYFQMCNTSPDQEQRKAKIPNDLIICRSKIFDYNDKNLILAIRTIVFKWAHCPCDRVGGLLTTNRLYQKAKVDSDEIAFKKLPDCIKSFSCKFEFHHKTTVFYFLTVYHRTGDGQAALFTTSSGNVGVAKFRIPSESGQNMKAAAEQEAEHWSVLWGVDAQVFYMVERYVVMMPFAFHFRRYESHLNLCSLSSWNHSVDRESDPFDDNLLKEDKVLKKCKVFDEYQNNPLKVAEEALQAMIYKGYC